MPIARQPRRARLALIALALLSACGARAPDRPAESGEPSAAPASPAAVAKPPATAATSGANPVCDPGAPESPCPIVGHWRIAKVFNPDAADPLEDDRTMIGAGLTITDNTDLPGALRWDGPDTGQFDVSDACLGPHLSARGQAVAPGMRDALRAALAAWDVKGAADEARYLGCDQGNWTVPIDSAGKWYAVVLPLGEGLALRWYEGRFLLLEPAPN